MPVGAMQQLVMAQARAGLSQCGKKIFLVFEDDTSEGSVIEMDLPTSIEVFGLLYQAIEEAKGLAALKTTPKDGRGPI